MVKKNNTILILGIIGIVFLLFYVMPRYTESGLSMKVTLYDDNGNVINVLDRFAVVEGVGGVSEIAIGAKVKNTGDVDLNCYISDSSDALGYFNDAMYYAGVGEQNSQLIQPNGEHTFWSNSFDVEPYGKTADTTFEIQVCCNRESTGELVSCKEDSITLDIQEEAADFSVNVVY